MQSGGGITRRVASYRTESGQMFSGHQKRKRARRLGGAVGLIILAWLSGAGWGCQRPDPADAVSAGAAAPVSRTLDWPAQVDGDRALAEVAQLVALGSRDAGTAGGQRAAEHLLRRLQADRIEAEIDAFEDATPIGRMQFRNVMGRIPGRETDGIVILGSHYDTKSGIGPGFEGANDSGSSTGLLLELGRLLQQYAPLPGPSIVLAFFDGEECLVAYGPNDGLHGSRYLARRLRETGAAEAVRAVVVMDMIGDRDLIITIPRNTTPGLRQRILQAAADVGARRQIGLLPHAILDDHAPFLQAGMPAVLLIDFEYGSAPGRNDYWHTLEDTIDKLSAASLAVSGRIVMRMLATMMTPHE